MATSLTYAFNRDLLLNLINTPGCDKVVFSLINLVKPRKTEAYMYVFAEAYSGNEPMLGIPGEKGCPTPPGWQEDPPPGDTDRSMLAVTPQFSVSQADLLPLVVQNELVMENTNQFLVHLDAENNEDGMEPFISLTCLKANRTVKLPAIKATHFTATASGSVNTMRKTA
ncbi:hypothetical protein D3H65_24975 [Paraflavitalea soli]|uniref:Uncharacterized protein n=1 Tax=Paraflavitalea soli TaxID=2315862 RepID=A0A3B7MUY1_9BACT|nr:hypothetical protein [Paraflavitalea soli]AXY77039.1 hypothetical protein D3H65_24975 [Paraflavitalea soli]